MNVSRRGFLSFLAGAAVPTIIAGGIIRVGGLIKPPAPYTVMGYDLGVARVLREGDLILYGQSWTVIGLDAHGNLIEERINPFATNGTNVTTKKFHRVTGIVT